MSNPDSFNNSSSSIQLAKEFNAEKKARERQQVKKLIESRELLKQMSTEFQKFIRANPAVAIEIKTYFESSITNLLKTVELKKQLSDLQNESSVKDSEEEKVIMDTLPELPEEEKAKLTLKKKLSF